MDNSTLFFINHTTTTLQIFIFIVISEVFVMFKLNDLFIIHKERKSASFKDQFKLKS